MTPKVIRNIPLVIGVLLVMAWFTTQRNANNGLPINSIAQEQLENKTGIKDVSSKDYSSYPKEHPDNFLFTIPKSRDDIPEMQERTQELIKSKNKGEILWGSDKWMKPAAAYRQMDTFALVDECFNRPIFGFETQLFDDPLLGLLRLEVFHDGFRELFKRNDLWKGVIHYFDAEAELLKPDIDFNRLVNHMLNLDSIPHLYELSAFAKQMEGHEREYLDAHLRLIHAFIKFIDTYDSTKTGGSYGFYGTPIIIACQAVILYKIVKPSGYSEFDPQSVLRQFSPKQDIAQVKGFLLYVIEHIEKKATK